MPRDAQGRPIGIMCPQMDRCRGVLRWVRSTPEDYGNWLAWPHSGKRMGLEVRVREKKAGEKEVGRKRSGENVYFMVVAVALLRKFE